MYKCSSRAIRLASRRLMWVIREATGIPRIDVLVDYCGQDHGHATVSEVGFGAGKWYRLDQLRQQAEDPPAADIRIVMQDEEVARAEWDGRGGISGRVDPHGAMGFVADGTNVGWEEWVEFQGRIHPSQRGQLPLFPSEKDPEWERRNRESPPSVRLPLSKAPVVPQVPMQSESVANRMLAVRDVHAAGFATALDMWVQNLAGQIAEFEALDLDKYARCGDCGRLIEKATATKAGGGFYCDEHTPAICQGCDKPILSDDVNYNEEGDPYCKECFTDKDALWDRFYAAHPNLHDIDALDQAAAGDEMEPEVYVAIFRDLDWNSAYGGKAWANIAGTWRDLKAAVDGKDWGKMHLIVDHAFDLMHNNGSLFTKANRDIQQWLFQALEDKYFLDPLQYRGKLSNDVRRLLDLHIRYSGGVAKWKENVESREQAMEKFEKVLLKDQDGRMAERLWGVHRMDASMFRSRDAFLEVAFWSLNRTQIAIHDACTIRMFLHAQDRETAMAAMTAIRPSLCKAGTGHPAGKALREEFVPKLLKLVAGDPDLQEELEKEPDEENGIDRPWHLDEWGEFLKAEGRRQEEEKSLVVAIASAFLKIALSPTDFYDFYALSVVGCGGFDDDTAKMCSGLKKVTTLDVARAIVKILAQAVVREATHAGDMLSVV